MSPCQRKSWEEDVFAVFRAACDLLLAGLSTFPSCAMLSFKKFIFYAVILALLCCDRPTLREKVRPPSPPGGAVSGQLGWQ